MDFSKPRRRTVRYADFDYTSAGGYFITVCAAKHRPFFGAIESERVQPNWVGQIVEREWLRMAQLRPEIGLDTYIVMPDHFHAIVHIHRDEVNGVRAGSSVPPRFGQAQAGSLAMIVGGFKSAVTREVNRERAARRQAPVVVWQSRFYDRIIRDETEAQNTRRYILENPMRWKPHAPPS